MGISNTIPPSRLIQPGVCTSSTRPSSPFEGQAIFETDTDRMYIWNGTAWVIPNAPAQNPTGLELVTTATCSSGGTASGGVITIGSAVSSVVIANAFSATYDDYYVKIQGGTCSTNVNLRLVLGSTATGYYGSLIYASYAAGTIASGFDNNATNFTYCGVGSTTKNQGIFDIHSPFLAEETSFYMRNADVITGGNAGTYNGFLNNTTSYTGFTISPASGTLTGGTIRIYGYRNS